MKKVRASLSTLWSLKCSCFEECKFNPVNLFYNNLVAPSICYNFRLNFVFHFAPFLLILKCLKIWCPIFQASNHIFNLIVKVSLVNWCWSISFEANGCIIMYFFLRRLTWKVWPIGKRSRCLKSKCNTFLLCSVTMPWSLRYMLIVIREFFTFSIYYIIRFRLSGL